MSAHTIYWEDQSNSFTLRIATLIRYFQFNLLTVDEHDELDEWVSRTFVNQQIFEKLTEPLSESIRTS